MFPLIATCATPKADTICQYADTLLCNWHKVFELTFTAVLFCLDETQPANVNTGVSI
jgi:hypothetical protein